MWHEARKQEKKVREVMVNLQRRAERRKEHYERLMGDPMQLLRITGTKAKIHLDPAVAAAGDSKTTMMPWSGNPEILISQYDVRVHLDTIPDYSKLPKPQLSSAEYAEEMKCNYERYRNLVINLFQEVSEEDYLKRINIEEMYPKHSTARNDKEKVGSKAAIGYSYGDNVGDDYNMSDNDSDAESVQEEEVAQLNVDDLATTDVDKLNLCALEFKISAGYFGRMLHEEKSYQSQQQYARQMAAETRHLHGKHAKRERRLFRESKRFSHNIQTTPPSYAQRDSPTYEPYNSNERRQSHSRSSTPEMVQSKVEYITEFGAASDNDEGKSNKADTTQSSHNRSSISSPRSTTHRHHHASPNHSRGSPSRSYTRRRSRSRSNSRERYHRHRRSKSRDSERKRYRSRSSSAGRSGYKSYSRSRTSHHRSHYSNSRSRTRSRSPVHHRSRYHRSHSSSSDSSRSRTPSPVNKRPTKVSTSEKKDSSTKKTTSVKSKLTPQERLQKKLQLQLNKQLKQDKKTQKIKANIKAAEQMEREDDLREQARKWKSRDSEGYYRD